MDKDLLGKLRMQKACVKLEVYVDSQSKYKTASYMEES